MLQVGKVYSAEIPAFRIHFVVLSDNDATWTINITAIDGSYPEIKLGKAHVLKNSGFMRHAMINDLNGLIADDPERLNDLINLALDTKDKIWFYQLTEKKKRLEV